MRGLLLAGAACALVLGAAAGCDKKARGGGAGSGSVSPSVSPSPSPEAAPVVAELASVTLAEDCGQHAAVAPTGAAVASADQPADGPAPGASATMAKAHNRVVGGGARADISVGAARGKCAGPNCNFNRPRACQQTTMQLTLTAPAQLPATTVEVVKVELLDEGTKASLGELTAREPGVWRTGGQYQPWDGTINGSDGLNVSYKLTAPDWDRLAGGRALAAGKTFLMRVTLRIGGKESAVDRVVQSAPLMVEPHVMT